MNTPESAIASPQTPAIIVIFGITGDLAKRKLLPALYRLFKDDLLDPRSVVLGITRRDLNADDLLADVELCVSEADNVCDPEGIRKLRHALKLHQMSQVDPEEYKHLRDVLNDIESEAGTCMNRLYYLSIPPQMFGPIVRNLGEQGLNTSCSHGEASTRLLIEKPFGYDLNSARELIAETGSWFHEDQIFRIDHYLAKETVQNILAFRMHNPLFTSLWNNQYIESIQITAFEQIDIEGRATFYEEVGALRDFVQSHLMQLMAVVTMQLPENLSSDNVHASKLQLLESIRPLRTDELNVRAIRGQYEGYRSEVQNEQSSTETYVSLTLDIQTDQWSGVPVTLRTGKALAEKRTDVRIRFKDSDNLQDTSNDLVFRLQPNEGIGMHLYAKQPGYADKIQRIVMDFTYQESFNETGSFVPGHPDAYERVLVDAVRGDRTLFTTSDEVLAAWRVIEALQRAWSENGDGLIIYKKGTSEFSTPSVQS